MPQKKKKLEKLKEMKQIPEMEPSQKEEESIEKQDLPKFILLVSLMVGIMIRSPVSSMRRTRNPSIRYRMPCLSIMRSMIS